MTGLYCFFGRGSVLHSRLWWGEVFLTMLRIKVLCLPYGI